MKRSAFIALSMAVLASVAFGLAHSSVSAAGAAAPATGRTLVACGPLRPCSTSYSTTMSLSIAVTPSARPVTCTKMSLSLSCSMKPYAFSVENHLTLPWATFVSPLILKSLTAAAR